MIKPEDIEIRSKRNKAMKSLITTQIYEDDRFLKMSDKAQNLYSHLLLHADYEGFIGSPMAIIDMLSLSTNELWELKLSNFIIIFDSGVVVIKHWRLLNDFKWCMKTAYVDERSLLFVKENKVYSLREGKKLDDKVAVLNDNEIERLCEIAKTEWVK